MSISRPATTMGTPTSPSMSMSMSKTATRTESSATLSSQSPDHQRTPQLRQSPSLAELPSPWLASNHISSPTNTLHHELPGSKQTYNPPWAPFSIVTATDSLTSNFPYTSRLRDLLVTPDQWLQFTTEIISAAKLSFKEDAAAWTAGISTGTLATPFLLVLGPVAGFYAGKSVHKKAVAKKVRERLVTEGPLRATLRQWNEGVFLERGIQMWLEPPTTNGEVIVDAPRGATEKEIMKLAKKQSRRFRFICMPYDPRNKPIGSDHNPRSGGWSQSQIPVSPGAMMVNEDGKEKWDGTPVEVSGTREAVEVDGVRPVAELGTGTGMRKKSSNVFYAELVGSEPVVVKVGK